MGKLTLRKRGGLLDNDIQFFMICTCRIIDLELNENVEKFRMSLQKWNREPHINVKYGATDG